MNATLDPDTRRVRVRLAAVVLLIAICVLLPALSVQCGDESWIRWFLWHARRGEPLSKIWLIQDISAEVQKLDGRTIGLRMEMPEYPVVEVEAVYYTMNYVLYPRRARVGPPEAPVRSGHDVLELLVKQRERGFAWDTAIESAVTFFSEKHGTWGFETSDTMTARPVRVSR